MISADCVREQVSSGALKKQVKEYLKAKYNIDLLKFTKAFGKGTGTYYYINTAQPLPLEYHSGWASPNAGQVKLARLLSDIEKFNQ